jgi:hypothetical protein
VHPGDGGGLLDLHLDLGVAVRFQRTPAVLDCGVEDEGRGDDAQARPALGEEILEGGGVQHPRGEDDRLTGHARGIVRHGPDVDRDPELDPD